jgi:hypothetical protein
MMAEDRIRFETDFPDDYERKYHPAYVYDENTYVVPPNNSIVELPEYALPYATPASVLYTARMS